MRRGLLSILILVAACSRVEAGCIDPAPLFHSTVSITRYFDGKEKEAPPGVLGMSGTGWFLSPTSMVTIEHVATSMNLSDQSWKQLEIWTGGNKQSIPVRIERLVGSHAEKIAVLELQTAFSGAQGLQLRMEPLVPEEPVVSLAYPGDQLRVAGGRFVHYGDGDRFPGMALLEMYDGDDRLVLDYGASGAPVFDCAGQVVSVVSKLFVTTIQFMSRVTRIPTAWGNPNIVSVPIDALKGFSPVEQRRAGVLLKSLN
jgi:Trypsin-like peptidase domain